MLVSIIIPAYNTAPYIHKAIESSLRQTHKNVEVIIVDDGSTDETLRTAQSYASRDERIRVFTQPNAGVSAARNHAMREAKGEYIVFLDSDDWLEDDAVEVLLAAQLEHPDKLIGALFCSVSEDGIRTPSNKELQQTTTLTVKDIAESYCGVNPAHAGFHSACAKIYSAEILAHNHITFPEGIAYSEDAVFVMKYLYKVDGAVLLKHPVYNVLERQSSAIRAEYKPSMLKSQIDAYDILINLPENTPEVKKLMSLSRTRYIRMYLTPGLKKRLPGISSKEIAQIRRYLRPSVWEFLCYKKLPLKNRVSFLFEMYLPVWSYRHVMRLWRLVKLVLGRK